MAIQDSSMKYETVICYLEFFRSSLRNILATSTYQEFIDVHFVWDMIELYSSQATNHSNTGQFYEVS